MSQSGFIAAMLLAAFILWLAVNDRLTTYTNVLFGATEAPKPSGSVGSSSGGPSGGTPVSNNLGLAADALAIFGG